MSGIVFGTPEHIAGLSREALEADFRYVQDRRMELEEACERLQAENAKLRELMRVVITYCVNGYCGKDDGCPLRLTDYDCQLLTKASELGVEV